ncbi:MULTISPECIES: DUF4307 domain-containing protein [unclassified Amycolatopsis]|uniref:DUF4307 domain-containing protein n=1 Tax=unclassified Amycolatopsis TaxID=2618356 RepID=UPI002E157AF4|nr:MULTISPECIES: DUF4307 domain-containing protein [unclassified Amycolatopsis]WSJ73984.1 DUF4307 domain-containing protein [Amycolatopsis sp. NBC_01307]WSK82374.1 DUF4307 domain-containing protein [Amycolatopsis sp. NBC_01286]
MAGGPAETVVGSSASALPEGRYGTDRAPTSRRWRRWLFLAIALVVSGVVAYVAYVNLGSAPIDAERVAFSGKPGNAMEITLNVTRDDNNRPGVCVVRVRDKTGAESGRKELLIPAGAKYSTITTTIKSIGAPVTADVYGCSYDIPRYLSTP